MSLTPIASASGSCYESRGRWHVRVSLGHGARCASRMPNVTSRKSAEALSGRIARMVARFRHSDQYDVEVAEKLVERAATGDRATLADLERIVDGFVAGKEKLLEKLPARAESVHTFRSVFTRWNKGELAEEFPDHIRAKRTVDEDRHRANKHILNVRLADGSTFGDKPLDAVVLEDCERVMSEMPRVLSRASRRHTAQLMHRVFAMAVYPLRIVRASPLPRGFLPPPHSSRVKAYLFPEEEAQLLGCVSVPLEYRLLYGLLAREGLRKGEALGLRWRDLDLERGMIRLDVNKNDDPRAWAMAPDVVASLKAWRALHPTRDTVFILSQRDRIAGALRRHLELAGVQRPELFENSKTRLRLRVHDFRATFVTVNLAHGKTETWIADRTGHRSSVMINAYRRQARTWTELGIAPLAPMNDAIPEFCQPTGLTAAA
jgi:integrase